MFRVKGSTSEVVGLGCVVALDLCFAMQLEH